MLPSSYSIHRKKWRHLVKKNTEENGSECLEFKIAEKVN
jgi:hypothetical protein